MAFPNLDRYGFGFGGVDQPVLEDELLPGKPFSDGNLDLEVEASAGEPGSHLVGRLVLNELSARLPLCGRQRVDRGIVDEFEDRTVCRDPSRHIRMFPPHEGDESPDAGDVEENEGRRDASPADRVEVVASLEAEEINDPLLERRGPGGPERCRAKSISPNIAR